MSSLTAHRVAIVVLLIFSGWLSFRLFVSTGGPKLDGNPIGFDVVGQQPVSVSLQNPANVSCLTSGSSCSATAELHYLTAPAPTCPPQAGIGTNGCATPPPPPPGSTRELQTCGSNQTCLLVNEGANVAGDQFQTQMQDLDQLHGFSDDNAQMIVILTPSSISVPAKKKPAK